MKKMFKKMAKLVIRNTTAVVAQQAGKILLQLILRK